MAKFPLRTRLLAITILTIVLLLFAEFALRALGFETYEPVLTEISSEPAHALVPHAKYGLALNPGTFTVRVNEHLQYQATHHSDSSRICGDQSPKQKLIHLYGCSLTYGMGVNDEATYAALLQKTLPDFQVKNYAVPGYGTIQSLLQLQLHLQQGLRPDLVILGYSSLHDARNMLTGIQQKYWSATLSSAVHPEMSGAAFPYAKMKGDGIEIHAKLLADFSKPWKVSEYAVLLYRLEMVLSNIWYGFTDKYKLSERIVQEMASLCQKHDVPFYIMALDKSPSLNKLEKFATAKGISFVDAGIDLFDQQLNLQPHDAHPNGKAHQVYAEKLFSGIRPLLTGKLIIAEE